MRNNTSFPYIIIPLILLGLVSLGLTFHGIYLGFCAGLGIGFIVLLVEPLPLIASLAYIFFGYNIPEAVINLFN